ncbi:hypothetical protein B0H14DRAFT_2560554 [Mycena olivaceomarginata]|nr:hypothetical protein B0H14DRAFT_2560554 [Mycena olivaceomarginata]
MTLRTGNQKSSVQFRKYSGTLDHPRHNDKQGATINVFQHFSYFELNKTLGLADIQGSEHYDPSNKATILFDLMSHTTTGDTGARDHGEAGIKSFLDQHRSSTTRSLTVADSSLTFAAEFQESFRKGYTKSWENNPEKGSRDYLTALVTNGSIDSAPDRRAVSLSEEKVWVRGAEIVELSCA